MKRCYVSPHIQVMFLVSESSNLCDSLLSGNGVDNGVAFNDLTSN